MCAAAWLCEVTTEAEKRVYGYIEPFYQAAPAAREPGHIWSDQPVYMPPRHGLKLTRVNPSDDRDLDFEIVGRTADTFNHAPVHSLRLESSEALVVTRAKWDRPVVILGGASASAVTPGSVHPTHLDNVWAVPIYGGDQYPEALRRRIQRASHGSSMRSRSERATCARTAA